MFIATSLSAQNASISKHTTSGDFLLAEFKAQVGVIVEINNQTIETIFYKSIIIKNKNKQSYFFENVSGYFSNDFKKEIEKLETNDLVVVYDIQGKTMYKTYNCKNALVFTMK